MSARGQYDVVLYGATGFTGQQTARYFEANAPAGLRWAIAGRSAPRLEALARTLSKVAGVVVADSQDHHAVDAMVAQTRVLLTTAGPFALYGERVLAACAQQGVDYVDITGETPFIQRMIARYHEEAQRSGARVVPFCGFDSVPSDLGAWMMVQALRAQGQGCRRVDAYFQARGGFNGGTLASGLTLLEQEGPAVLADPFLLNPPDQRPPHPEAHADRYGPGREAALGGRWTAPFFMAPINTRVVRRSAALFAAWEEPYGADFTYQESMGPLPMVAALGISAAMAVARVGGQYAMVRALARRLGPAPGQGPSPAVMESGFMRVRYFAEGEQGLRLQGELRAAGDPGNRITVQILCESALALATQRSSLPGGTRAGVLTPATALGGLLLERLQRSGMTATVASADYSQSPSSGSSASPSSSSSSSSPP